MKAIPFFLALTLALFADIDLDQLMSKKTMKRLGIDRLSYTQKQALEDWIDANFTLKETQSYESQEQLHLSLNIEEGAKLELSDGSIYEIDPEDRLFTSYWITPFPIKLSPSNNPDYPVKITNMTTGTSVSGRPISKKEVLLKEKERAKKRRERAKKYSRPKSQSEPLKRPKRPQTKPIAPQETDETKPQE